MAAASLPKPRPDTPERGRGHAGGPWLPAAGMDGGVGVSERIPLAESLPPNGNGRQIQRASTLPPVAVGKG